MEDYILAVIYTQEPIDKVIDLLDSYDPNAKPNSQGVAIGGDSVKIIRSDYKHGKNQDSIKTNRLIVGMKKSALKLLAAEGYDKPNNGYDFRISEYEIREINYPPKDCVYALFLLIPVNLNPNVKVNKAGLEEQIAVKMSKIVEMGLVTSKQFKVIFPANNKTHTYLGSMVITFDDIVTVIDRVKIKIILDSTFWNDVVINEANECQQYFCHVAWCLSSAYHKIRSRKP